MLVVRNPYIGIVTFPLISGLKFVLTIFSSQSPSPSNQGAEGFNYYEDDDEANFGNFSTSRKNPAPNKTSSIGSGGRKQV
jgi:hypothetical protein